MNRLLTSNLARHRLARTIIQGVIGVIIANLVTSHDDLQQARAKYHSILSAAAVSGLDSHAAVLMEENGFVVAHECYTKE